MPPRPRLLTDLTDRCAACRVFCQGVPAGPALVRPRPLSSSSSPQRRPAQGHQETEGARQRLRHHPRGRHLPHSVRAGGAQHGSHGGAAAGRGTGRLPRGGRGTRVRACVCVRAWGGSLGGTWGGARTAVSGGDCPADAPVRPALVEKTFIEQLQCEAPGRAVGGESEGPRESLPPGSLQASGADTRADGELRALGVSVMLLSVRIPQSEGSILLAIPFLSMP